MGRGSSKAGGGVQSGSIAYHKASQNYTVEYHPYADGQISRTDAGQLYKAVKSGNVTAKPELVSELYDGTKAQLRFATMRYTQDYMYYDNVHHLTHSLLNNDFKTAQLLINEIEKDNIKRSGKKSKWYKYR